LNAAGEHLRAKTVCLALEAQGSMVINLRDAQLALAEAGLGNFALANALLDAVIERATPDENPLALGNAHRDRATVALLARDQASFERQLQAASECFRSTGNPSLIHQVDMLLAEAVRDGLVAPQSGCGMGHEEIEDTLADGVTVPSLQPTMSSAKS
jgi:hypothetical protein